MLADGSNIEVFQPLSPRGLPSGSLSSLLHEPARFLNDGINATGSPNTAYTVFVLSIIVPFRA